MASAVGVETTVMRDVTAPPTAARKLNRSDSAITSQPTRNRSTGKWKYSVYRSVMAEPSHTPMPTPATIPRMIEQTANRR
jgi:hypothetical protein